MDFGKGYDATVFNQWANRPDDQRFDSLAALKASVTNRAIASREIGSDIKSLRAIPNPDGVHFEHELVHGPLVPTNYGFTQFCQRMSAPAKFLRETLSSDTELLAEVINHSIDEAPKEKDVKLLYTEGDDYSEYRSATSLSYGRIWDMDVVEKAEQIVEFSGGKFYSPLEWGKQNRSLYASDSDVFMFFIDGGSLVDGGGERDQLNRGFYMWNSEVGKKVMGIKTFLFQVVCGNFQIWGQEDVKELRIRHNGRAPARFAEEAFPILRDLMNASPKGDEDTIHQLKAFELPADDAQRIKWVMNHGFNKKEASSGILLAEHELGECKNLWQLMDGLTMYARQIPHVDTKQDLEIRSGNLTRLVS